MQSLLAILAGRLLKDLLLISALGKLLALKSRMLPLPYNGARAYY